MTRDSRRDLDWQCLVERLGGAEALTRSAHDTKAFRRARKVASAVVLLRLLLAYCMGWGGLRSTAAWAAAVDLADISNVALLNRLRNSGAWLEHLVSVALRQHMPKTCAGRRIRIVDGTTVPKAGGAGSRNALWRLHAAFDVGSERFDAFVLTDESEGERFDRIPVEKGELRICDRCFMQPGRIAAVIEQGGDVLIRAGWRSAIWLTPDGQPFDLAAALGRASSRGRLDIPIHVGRRGGGAIALRLVAVKKPRRAAAQARAKARREAQREGRKIMGATLAAADWMILVTTLQVETHPTDAVLDLYRLRWRVELAFKRLKSLVGLKGPPGNDADTARAFLLAHLLMILLLEPLVDRLEDSPHWADAA